MDAAKFLDNFGYLAEAPNGVEKLREMVLDLAVRGKLAKQNSDDEPVSVQLSRIEEKKKSWIDEGRLRKSSAKKIDTEIEQPWTIPDNWKWVRFDDVTINRDAERIPLSREDRSAREGPFDYYGASGVIDHIDDFIFDTPLLLIGEDGANLINRSTPIAFIAEGEYWVNNHAHVLDSDSLNTLRYLEVFINAIDLKPYVTGTAQPKMNQAKMNSIAVAFPPSEEQQRIVAKVDELMALCDELEARQQERRAVHVSLNNAALDRLTSAESDADFTTAWSRVRNNFDTLYSIPESVTALRQTILQLAVMGKLVKQDPNDEPVSLLIEDIYEKKAQLVADKLIPKQSPLPIIDQERLPFPPPSKWQWIRLESVCEVITKGSSPKWQGVNYVVEGDGVLFITSENVGNYTLRKMDQPKFVEAKFNEMEPRSILQRDDILVTLVGASIGRSAIYDKDGLANINQAVGIVRLVRGVRQLNRRFLLHYLNSPVCLTIMFENQVETARANISLTNVKHFLVPVPPLAEQDRIVARLDQLMSLCNELEARLTQQQTDADHLTEAMIASVLEGAV
jgi:type I restriction enzyme S subunit